MREFEAFLKRLLDAMKKHDIPVDVIIDILYEAIDKNHQHHHGALSQHLMAPLDYIIQQSERQTERRPETMRVKMGRYSQPEQLG